MKLKERTNNTKKNDEREEGREDPEFLGDQRELQLASSFFSLGRKRQGKFKMSPNNDADVR